MADDLADQVRELRDREAIREILYTYVDRVDAGDIDAVAALFADDAVYDFMGTERQGRDRIGQRIRRALAQYAHTSHHLSNPLVVVDGDTARQSASLYAYHVRSEDESVWHLWGRYRQVLERRGDGWQIVRMELHAIDGFPNRSDEERALYKGHPDRRPVIA
jgi:uncharacterized protein (TIGR02246 family)